jgi:hypothetical protein
MEFWNYEHVLFKIVDRGRSLLSMPFTNMSMVPVTYIREPLSYQLVPGFYLEFQPAEEPGITNPGTIVLRGVHRGDVYTLDLSSYNQVDLFRFRSFVSPIFTLHADRMIGFSWSSDDSRQYWIELDELCRRDYERAVSFLKDIRQLWSEQCRQEAKREEEKLPVWREFVQRLPDDKRLVELLVKLALFNHSYINRELRRFHRGIYVPVKGGLDGYLQAVDQMDEIITGLVRLVAMYHQMVSGAGISDRGLAQSGVPFYLVRGSLVFHVDRFMKLYMLAVLDGGAPADVETVHHLPETAKQFSLGYRNTVKLAGGRIGQVIELIDSVLDGWKRVQVSPQADAMACIL